MIVFCTSWIWSKLGTLYTCLLVGIDAISLSSSSSAPLIPEKNSPGARASACVCSPLCDRCGKYKIWIFQSAEKAVVPKDRQTFTWENIIHQNIPRTNISTPMFLSLLAYSSTGSWDFPSVMIMATLGKAFLDPPASVKMFCRR